MPHLTSDGAQGPAGKAGAVYRGDALQGVYSGAGQPCEQGCQRPSAHNDQEPEQAIG